VAGCQTYSLSGGDISSYNESLAWRLLSQLGENICRRKWRRHSLSLSGIESWRDSRKYNEEEKKKAESENVI